MSWGFAINAKSKEGAKKEIDKQTYCPEGMKQLLKDAVDAMGSGPQYGSQGAEYLIHVESNGHHDGTTTDGRGGNGNGQYKVHWVEVVS